MLWRLVQYWSTLDLIIFQFDWKRPHLKQAWFFQHSLCELRKDLLNLIWQSYLQTRKSFWQLDLLRKACKSHSRIHGKQLLINWKYKIHSSKNRCFQFTLTFHTRKYSRLYGADDNNNVQYFRTRVNSWWYSLDYHTYPNLFELYLLCHLKSLLWFLKITQSFLNSLRVGRWTFSYKPTN